MTDSRGQRIRNSLLPLFLLMMIAHGSLPAQSGNGQSGAPAPDSEEYGWVMERTIREKSEVSAARFIDDRRLMTITSQSIINIWDTETGALVTNLQENTPGVLGFGLRAEAALSRDGNYILTTRSVDTHAILRDARTYEELGRFHVHGPYGKNVSDYWFHPDSRSFITYDDLSIWEWDVASGELLQEIGPSMQLLPILDAFFSPDGMAIIAIVGFPDRVLLYETQTGQIRADLDLGERIIGYVVDPTGAYMFAHLYDGELVMIDLQRARIRSRISTPLRNHDALLQVSDDGKYFSIHSRYHSMATGVPIDTFYIDAQITASRFSQNGRVFYMGGFNGLLKRGLIETGELIDSMQAHNTWINSIEFNPGTTRMATASKDSTVAIWKQVSLSLPTDANRLSEGRLFEIRPLRFGDSQLFVDVADLPSRSTFSVVDMHGREVCSRMSARQVQESGISIADLPTGVYMLTLRRPDGRVATERFVRL